MDPLSTFPLKAPFLSPNCHCKQSTPACDRAIETAEGSNGALGRYRHRPLRQSAKQEPPGCSGQETWGEPAPTGQATAGGKTGRWLKTDRAPQTLAGGEEGTEAKTCPLTSRLDEP